MADQDSAGLFGLDDSNPGLNPNFLDNSDGQAMKRDPSASITPSDEINFYSNWTFQDTPPGESYDSFNIAGSSAASAAPLFQTASWEQLSPSQQHQQPLPTTDNNLDQPNIRSADFYSGHMAPNPAVNPRAAHSQRVAGPTETLNLLTPAQQEKLRSIAMPAHLQYHSPKSEPSPGSATSDANKAAGFASPDGPGNSRKRKCSADAEDDEDEDDENQPIKKTAHNMIEKRYRTNLNDKIAALRDSVPSLRIMSKSVKGEDTTEDREELHGLTPAHKLNKATVLSKATEYIRHLEKRNTRLLDENSAMQARISAFEKLFMAGAMNGAISPMQQPPTPMQYPQDVQFVGTPIGTPGRESVQGMIQVPDDMKRIISAQMAVGQPYPVPQQPYHTNAALIRQQQIQQQQQQQMQQGRWGQTGPYFGKLMVGSLAGLMIIEAVRENEQSNETPEGRGLFAVPVQFLSYLGSSLHMHIAGHYIAAGQVITYLKVLLFMGTMLWVFVPSLFVTPDKNPKKGVQVRGAIVAAPSLSSPIHVRRQAWLTAIQSVWVPRHNFILEVAAILLKTIKLSLRNTIGTHGYQMLTGLTEEQEAARVKAWTIALDAQLAGGDVEINMSRLTLTLLVSGTLPDTPLRLMLKALHIRVVLWDLGRKGLHNVLAAKMARSRWNDAKQLYRVLNQLKRDATEETDEDLPEHLAALLEQDCDAVLNDQVIQRAYNLAWNLPTTDNVTEQVDGMDAVVDDPAVRSPMDAVAAWWSSQTIQRTLIASIVADKEDSEALNSISTNIGNAVKASPIGSGAQARALVARAVLVDEKRGASIASALQTLRPLDSPMSLDSVAMPIMDLSSSVLMIPDIQMSLRCAMAIAHLQRIKTTAPPHEGLRLVDAIALPGATMDMSLLGCTALFKLMEELHAHRAAAETFCTSLERLAGSLRIWVGSAPGDKCGLDQELRHNMVDRCLAITKSVVGMDNDTGYGSMSECEDEHGC